MEQLNNNEYNILVVEDDKEIRDGIEIFLKARDTMYIKRPMVSRTGSDRAGNDSSCDRGHYDAADGWRDHDDQIERTS